MLPNDLVFAKSDKFAHKVYELSLALPKDEAYGLTSQLKRAALSVPLNAVEGYARQSRKTQAQFLRIAYGSLKESLYLIDFAVKQNLLEKKAANSLLQDGDELAKVIWAKTKALSIET